MVWSGPPTNVIKLNVDAALSTNSASLIVVVRDDCGMFLSGWTKRILVTDPTIAEASTIVWGLEIAKETNYQKVIIDGDAKVCLDALSGDTSTYPWKIQTLYLNALDLTSYFSFCSFG
jgi:ribonuclease HI|uniref:RNase H type-1 domain-containing protein n=1 Tax=Fagus sylvatica TaxID=28930 RepID=A0A2N9I137_FAGSY